VGENLTGSFNCVPAIARATATRLVENFDPNPPAYVIEVTCENSDNCSNKWMSPHMVIRPPTMEVNGYACYGGTLEAEYLAGGDPHTWFVVIMDGRPFLTR
jgi:hypothetical protein